MTRFRRNPGLFDDDDEPESSFLRGLSEQSDFEQELRASTAQADREQDEQQRVEAAKARGGVSARVLQLAENGLRGSLSDAQDLYAKLGTKLDEPSLSRQERRDTRDARRLLEDAWGVNALRLEPRPSLVRRFRPAEILARSVPISIDPREPTATLQAAASFSRKYAPMGRGLVGQKLELKGVYYGIDAQDQADRDYAQMLIDEGKRFAERLALLEARGVPASDSRRQRVEYRLNEIKLQKDKLVERRQATAKKLKELLG